MFVLLRALYYPMLFSLDSYIILRKASGAFVPLAIILMFFFLLTFTYSTAVLKFLRMVHLQKCLMVNVNPAIITTMSVFHAFSLFLAM